MLANPVISGSSVSRFDETSKKAKFGRVASSGGTVPSSRLLLSPKLTSWVRFESSIGISP